jgi:Arm DNA-binding domain
MAKAMTAVKVRGVKREGYHGDKGEGAARGLYVQVAYLRRGGVRSAKYGVTRSWIFRFVSPITRKTRWMGLGPCDVIGLAEARELARAARRLVVLGCSTPLLASCGPFENFLPAIARIRRRS